MILIRLEESVSSHDELALFDSCELRIVTLNGFLLLDSSTCRDVLLDDSRDRAVFCKLLKSLIDSCLKSFVLLADCHSVIFYCISSVKDLEVLLSSAARCHSEQKCCGKESCSDFVNCLHNNLLCYSLDIGILRYERL